MMRRGIIRDRRYLCQALVSSALLMAPVIVLASISNDFPWDSFFSKIVKDLTSNFVLGVATVGVVCCAGALIVNPDMQRFGKIAFCVGIGVSLIVSAPAVLTKLFGLSGAIC